ncbi:MAG: substrate-binding domain-containing protein [Nitrospirae bacterium]|nr:substrate-binding domain-containing protein [Nitrospirota bacterium]
MELDPVFADDLVGDPLNARLILFMAGNQFMVLPDLIAAFRETCAFPHDIYYQSLPPGLLLRQILDGELRLGRLRLTFRPDLFGSTGEAHMAVLRERGLIEGFSHYIRNRLALMVRKGNPAGIKGLAELAHPEVRISMPDPAHEGIASDYILPMLERFGGKTLLDRLLTEKVRGGTTRLTTIHHRETPDRLLAGACDVGIVWASEVAWQQREGAPLEGVEIPPPFDMRDRVIYTVAVLKQASHPDAARAFVDFLLTAEAQALYAQHGFTPLDD